MSPPSQQVACPSLETFLAIAGALEPGGRLALVENLWACANQNGTPLIEAAARPGFVRAVFLYRGPAKEVLFVSGAHGFEPDPVFTRLPDTDLWHFAREFESDARLTYALLVDGKEIPDPLNARTVRDGPDTASVFAGPAYVPPAEIELQPQVPQGELDELTFISTVLGNTRSVRVYRPPGYAHSEALYPVLYVHDGGDYLRVGKLRIILDNLIHQKRIPPILAVMVPPVNRDVEYRADAEFARAFANELVPWIDSRYRTDPRPEMRALLGASAGGIASVYVAARYPDVFGNAAAQSASFPKGGEATYEVVRSMKAAAAKFHIDVGTYEASFLGLNLLKANREMRDLLRAKGHHVQYIEVHEGHGWGNWPSRIDDALEFFWGKRREDARS